MDMEEVEEVVVVQADLGETEVVGLVGKGVEDLEEEEGEAEVVVDLVAEEALVDLEVEVVGDLEVELRSSVKTVREDLEVDMVGRERELGLVVEDLEVLVMEEGLVGLGADLVQVVVVDLGEVLVVLLLLEEMKALRRVSK